MTGAFFDAAILIGATLATTLLLLLISGQLHDTTAGTLIARSAAPLLEPLGLSQPTPEQSSISHPTPSPQFTSSPASPKQTASTGENQATASVTDDSTIQAIIDSKLQDNAEFSAFSITATVNDGTVTVVGTVPSDEIKTKIEKLIRAVKGVKLIDNQIVVVSGE